MIIKSGSDGWSRGPISSSINSFMMSAARRFPSFTLSRCDDELNGDETAGAVDDLIVSIVFGSAGSTFLRFGSLSSGAGSLARENNDVVDPLDLGSIRLGDMPGPR